MNEYESIYKELIELGIFLQPNNKLVGADNYSLRTLNDGPEYMVFSNLEECYVRLLENALDDFHQYIYMWMEFFETLKGKDVVADMVPVDDMFVYNVENLADISEEIYFLENETYFLKSLVEKDKVSAFLRDKIVDASFIFRMTYTYLSQKLENVLKLKEIIEKKKLAGSDVMKKVAYYSKYDGGLGYKGNTGVYSIGPYSNIDIPYDRVGPADHWTDHDYYGPNGEGGGHATSKFKEFIEKFKKRFEPVGYSNQRRSLPTMERPTRRRRKGKGSPSSYVDKVPDPAKYIWNEWNRNPYSWDDRAEESSYKSWEQYRS